MKRARQGEGVETRPLDLAIYAMPGHLIRRMHQVSQALFESEASRAGFDLTPVQFAALHAVSASPGLDQATLAQAIAYDSVTIGGVLQRLEAKGFLRREVAISDRRARRVFIEPAGQAALSALTPTVRRVQEMMLAGLDADETEQFKRLLHRALDAVGNLSRAPLRPPGRVRETLPSPDREP